MTQPVIEDDTRPCPYSPCSGVMDSELDGRTVIWCCRTCGNEAYDVLRQAEDTCQMGLPLAQQPSQPAGPVFLGSDIGRRPE